ncbi:MAG: hypothetical protein ABI553_08340 [Chloroflexota bacterium]
MAILTLFGWQATVLAAPASESAYFDGQTYQINVAGAVKVDADPPLLRQAIPMFLIGFPVAPGMTGPLTLPSGYQPQANGIPVPVPYHDHVLSCVPAAAGRSCHYVARLRVVNLRYTWDFAYSLGFAPITRVQDIEAAEAAGHLQAINPGASDPYQYWTNDVLVRPVVLAKN